MAVQKEHATPRKNRVLEIEVRFDPDLQAQLEGLQMLVVEGRKLKEQQSYRS